MPNIVHSILIMDTTLEIVLLLFAYQQKKIQPSPPTATLTTYNNNNNSNIKTASFSRKVIKKGAIFIQQKEKFSTPHLLPSLPLRNLILLLCHCLSVPIDDMNINYLIYFTSSSSPYFLGFPFSSLFLLLQPKEFLQENFLKNFFFFVFLLVTFHAVKKRCNKNPWWGGGRGLKSLKKVRRELKWWWCNKKKRTQPLPAGFALYCPGLSSFYFQFLLFCFYCRYPFLWLLINNYCKEKRGKDSFMIEVRKREREREIVYVWERVLKSRTMKGRWCMKLYCLLSFSLSLLLCLLILF